MAAVQPGQRVTLKGINGAPELNGKAGAIVCFVEEQRRWKVQLDDGRTVNARPECLGEADIAGYPPEAPSRPSAADFGAILAAAAFSLETGPATPGQPCDIWSNSAGTWLAGSVDEVDGSMAIVSFVLPDGRKATKKMPADHEHLRLKVLPGPPGSPTWTVHGMAPAATGLRPAGGLRPVGATNGSTRHAVCLDGSKCTRREADHLAGHAHPFDPEYEQLCAKCGVAVKDQEEPTLMGLFRWLDEDASGKLSTEEIVQGLDLLGRLQGKEETTSVEALDEDGNGYVNFSEFAQWAGPRLNLPLGVQVMRAGTQGTGSFTVSSETCGINGCPCRHFDTDKKAQKKTKKKKKKRQMWMDAFFGQEDVDAANGNMCTCGHKRTAHVPTDLGGSGGTGEYPQCWSNQGLTGSPKDNFQEFVLVDRNMLPHFQQLLDATYKKTWTRDRRKHQPSDKVPQGYRVQQVFRNEHKKQWLGYQWRKAVLTQELEEQSDAGTKFALGPLVQHSVLSSRWHSGYVGQVACEGRPLLPDLAEPLHTDVNEWYLFHGCNDWVAHRICETDFHIGSAGKNTGTLYGGGSYLSESITKCDEYAKLDDTGLYTVLLCRCLGGRVRYTDEIEPDAEDLTQGCINGPYDCVLGDREKCRGTYREFVFYDSDDMYPEYIVKYSRI